MIQKNTIIAHTADMTHSWDTDKIKQYIFAGHAVFAVNDVIYTIRDCHNKHGWWTVYTKDETTPTWIQIGWVIPERLVVTKDVTACTEPKYKWTLFMQFIWWLKNHGLLPNKYVFQISRFCARCGTPLKSAKSLTLGYGPECIKKEKTNESR